MKLVVLSDLKPGHYNQSLGIIQNIPDCIVEWIDVQFQKKWKDNCLRVFFTIFGLYLIPTTLINSILQWSLDGTTYNKLITIEDADLILSTGSSVSTINLLISKILKAKTVTCRRPSPIGIRHFDLSILPMFSWNKTKGKYNVCKTIGVPNAINPNRLKSIKQQLLKDLKLQQRLRIGILLGGLDKYETITLEDTKKLIETCQSVWEKTQAHIFLTTSRRTPTEVTEYLKSHVENAVWCPIFVEPNKPTELEDPFQAILALSDLLIVTADSFSMVCEAASSGRKVLILKMSQLSNRQPKRYKVYEYMVQQSIASLCKIEELDTKIKELLTTDITDSVLTDTQGAANAIYSLYRNR